MTGDMIKPNRQLEQFFWDKETINLLTQFISKLGFKNIGCLACPSLGIAIPKITTILDIDTRFQKYTNFRKFDIRNPIKPSKEFDLLVVDSPDTLVENEQLRLAIEILCNQKTKLVIVDNEDGQTCSSLFPNRKFQKIGIATYKDPAVKKHWYLWGDI